MPAADPVDRRAISTIANGERWSRETDRTAATATARANGPGSLEYWFPKVDPDGELPYETRVKNAEAAKRAFYARLGRMGRKSRKKNGRSTAA